MTQDEASLISGLFDRLAQAPVQNEDADASRLISGRMASNPRAAYLLTQSVLVLQQAVTAAQGRIADLEKQLAAADARSPQQSGGFLSGVANLFGAPTQTPPPRLVAPPPLPQQTAPTAPSQGGGFLQNAMATAAGVAGGALLFQGIENLLGHNPGPFTGMGGGVGGSFAGQPAEIINNYYEAPASDPTDGGTDGDLGAQDGSFQDASQDDSGFVDSDFDSGDDDSSFV
jgi:uncharacterized protein